MEYLVLFTLNAVFGGLALFIAGKLTGLEIAFKEAAISVTVAALFALIPSIGWIVSVIAFLILLKHFTAAPVWPDILLTVVTSWLLINIALFLMS